MDDDDDKVIYATHWRIRFPNDGTGEGHYVRRFPIPVPELIARMAFCGDWHTWTDSRDHLPLAIPVTPVDGTIVDEED